jgi:hypothetical protein
MSGVERRPVGDIIDGLGIGSRVADDEIVSDAVVIMKVVEADGTVRLAMASSLGSSWVERLGMLTAAREAELACVRDARSEDGA